jgi:hypothetical protein
MASNTNANRSLLSLVLLLAGAVMAFILFTTL